MLYDNAAYWTKIHRDLTGTLRSVGFPNLSERFNELKYASEAETLHAVLQKLGPDLKLGGAEVRVLDAGAGVGYWTAVMTAALSHWSFRPAITALDLSAEGLAALKQRYPETNTVQADLTLIQPDRFKRMYDVVMSFYCLHHLPRLEGFTNALRFAANSVRRGGILLIMDPILSMPYSQLDSFDFYSWKGNGIPRHLYLLDDVLGSQGLTRVDFRPAVSFLLNGNIEARSRLCFTFCRRLWGMLGRIYRREKLTSLLSPILCYTDRVCKKKGWAYSSSLCTYRREIE
jgi:SAM-dependent methyltransferase